MKKLITILMLLPFTLWSQPPCPPFTACWCERHPTHPTCSDISIPISDWYGHMILLAGGLLLVYLHTRKQSKTKTHEK